ncbi:MAG TPA: hypothetical protein VFN08_07430 [Gemmatimonadales bacterium]|jgi:hypothetical protein|nr:hypothetical protein [Gemmatimonadales bacterium]
MDAQQHSNLAEGMLTGVIGAVIVAGWYFIVDTAGGQPLHTPNVLGKIFLRGDLAPAADHISTAAVLAYTVIHFIVFALIGIGLTVLVHQAERKPTLRMGVWLGFIIAFGLFAGYTYGLATAAGERFSPWSVISGSLLGVLGMAGYLWRRHPRLEQAFHEAPLGSEVPPPPHPPERPRAV